MFNVYSPDTPEVFRRAAEIMRERGLSRKWAPWVGYYADGTGDVNPVGRIGAVSAIAMAKGASYEEVSADAATASDLEHEYLSQLEAWLWRNCLARCYATSGLPRVNSDYGLEEELQEIEDWYAANMADILESVDLRRDLVPLSLLCQMTESDVLVLPEDTGVPTIIAADEVRTPEQGNYPEGFYGNFWSTRWDVDEADEDGPIEPYGWESLPDFVEDQNTTSGPDKIILQGSELKTPLLLGGNEFFLLHVGELARRAMAITEEIRAMHAWSTRQDAVNELRDVLAWDTARGRDRSHLYQVWDVDTCRAVWVTAEEVADRAIISTPEERAEEAQKIRGRVHREKDLDPIKPYLKTVEDRIQEQQETMPMIRGEIRVS